MANSIAKGVIATAVLMTPPALQVDVSGIASTQASGYTLSVPATASDALSINTPKGSFSWKPTELVYKDAAGNYDYIVGSSPSTLTTNNTQATYSRVFPSADDVFNAQDDRVKHWTILNEPPRAPASYLGDGVMFGVSGIINGVPIVAGTYDAINLEGMTLPQPLVKDLAGNEITGHYEVVEGDAGQQLFVWFDASFLTSAVYPIMIDPTVIVASAYDTSGNGGRKQVDLPGGRQIAIAVNASTTTIYAFKSDDKGTTWTQLCTISGAQVGAAICNVGNNCTVLFNNTTTVYSVTFDGTTVTNIDLNSTKKTVDIQTSILNNVSIASDGNGKLWPTWCSKNATFPNAWNSRVSSSSDGGNTWAAPTVITNQNTSGYDSKNSCLVVQSNNNPVFIYQYQTTAYGIGWNVWTGTTWSGGVVYQVSTYVQSNPCAALDGTDVIYSGWDGADSTTANHRARWSKSTNGGTTWSAMGLINPSSTNASTNVSFVVRPDNSVDAFWQEIDPTISATYTQIRRANLPAGSSTWSAPVTVTNNTTANATNPQTLWSKFNMNSADAIRYMWMTGSAINYDSISLNNPPNAPTLTAHANFDATVAQTFTATYSDPDSGDTMSARQLQFVDVGTGSTVYDTGKVAQTTTVGNQTFNVVVPANTLTNGKQYQWREMTWDSSGAQGPWSTYSTFYTAAAPTVTITAPTANQVVTTTQTTAQWSESDPGNNPQSTYEVQLKDSTGAITLWDSGKVSDVNARALTIGYTLANNTSYQVVVTVTNSKGIASAASVQSFSVSYTPPATVTIAVTPSPAGAYNSLAITNPIPSGQQPTVSSNDLYRKQTGSSDTPIRIAAGIANNGTYKDYTAPSGVSHDYYVIANGSNGTSSQSAVVSQTVTLAGVWMHDVMDPSTILHLTLGTLGTNKTTDWTPESTVTKPAGRTSPVVVFGETENYTYNLPVDMLKSAGTWSALDALARRKSVLCVRDYRGRKLFGVILDLPQQDEIYGQSANFTVTAVDYKEGV